MIKSELKPENLKAINSSFDSYISEGFADSLAEAVLISTLDDFITSIGSLSDISVDELRMIVGGNIEAIKSRATLAAMAAAGWVPAYNQFDQFEIHPLWKQHRQWSDATFGVENGPVGPLKHLAKEAIEAADNPTDVSEFADCMFLLWDAAHRAGFTWADIIEAGFVKMPILMSRNYAKPKDGEPSEHDRSKE